MPMISNVFKKRFRNCELNGGSISGTNFSAKRVTKTATGTLTLEECMGCVIDNYGQTASMTLTIPAAASTISFKFEVVTTGHAVYMKAGTGDKHYLDGVALDDGDKVGIASPALGDCLYVEGMRTGATSYDLRSSSGVGAWVDSGA